ncbi:MAG: response regulator [Bacteroidetes bacterium]|nr:response regulator [Bacteroidota bacterium]
MKNSKKTILVIEDEDFISGLIAKSLREEGYNVIVTSDYKSSIKVIDTAIIDLIVSDVMLPYTGGLDIAEYVKNDARNKDVPVILVTGMDKDVISTTAINVTAILSKPFDMLELVDLVNNSLSRKPAKNEGTGQ